MKKKIFSVLATGLFALLPLAGANLVPDPGFDADGADVCYYVNNFAGLVKVTRITENMTWNKCLKMETVKLYEAQGVKALSAELVFGKTNGKPGFAVEPDTVYNFSFDFKGNHQISLHVNLDSAAELKDWRRSAGRIRPNPRVAAADPEKWSTVKGSFKTASDTRWARLVFMFWADSKQQRNFKDKVGDFVLIDNVKIEKRRSLDDAVGTARAAAPVPQAYLANSSVIGKLTVDPAVWLKGTPDVPVKLVWESRKDALICKIIYDDPDTAKHKYFKQPQPVKNNGKAIWRDDVAELFFSQDEKNKEYIQFACSRNGGRCRIVSKREAWQLNKWSAQAVRRNDGKSEYLFAIPYRLLGYKKAPEPGSVIKFNAGIKHNGIYYSFAPIKASFTDVARFVRLGFGSIKDYQKKVCAELKSDAPAAVKPQIDIFGKNNFASFALAIQAAENLKSRIKSAKLGSAPFILAQLPLTGNFSAPLEVGAENVVQTPIKLQAAGREIAMVPLVIVNRTGKTASYRVVLHDDAKNFYLHENHTLSGGFPEENITLREGIAVKDSDSKNPGILFDSLPGVNDAQVVTAAPGEGALVWVELDTTSVKPGIYNGSFRVIPLSEPAEHTAGGYKGEVRDYPISLEVLPFELPPPGAAMLCSNAGTLDHLRYMLQIGGGRVHITPFLVKHKFDSQGNLIDDNGSHERLVAEFKAGMEQYRRLNALDVKRKFLFGYSTYLCFLRTSMPKGMKIFTPEWENCWRNHLKAIRKAILAGGVSMDDVVFEIWDEPKGERFKEVLRAAQIMRQTLPDALLSISWAAQNFEFTPDMMKHFDDILDEQIFHRLLRTDPVFKPQIKNIRDRKNTLMGMYACSTVMREDLHSYYRLHPWYAYRMGSDIVCLYQFSAMSWGKCGATDWKRIPGGAIVNRAGRKCIPSIRYMALRRGVDDIRYLKALQKYAGKPDVDKLLKNAAQRVEDGSFDASVPDTIRAEAIKLILKYQR